MVDSFSKRRRGDIKRRALEILQDSNLSFGDFFCAFLSAGYGASFNKLQKEMNQARYERAYQKAIGEEWNRIRKRYSDFVYVLKRDGMIAEKDSGSKKFFSLTVSGRMQLREMNRRVSETLPAISQYHATKTNESIIVIFDVPEEQKRKRQWLRQVLKRMGFVMVQKSVWRGKVKLPEEFVVDLRRMDLLDYVEVAIVKKLGTLG